MRTRTWANKEVVNSPVLDRQPAESSPSPSTKRAIVCMREEASDDTATTKGRGWTYGDCWDELPVSASRSAHRGRAEALGRAARSLRNVSKNKGIISRRRERTNLAILNPSSKCQDSAEERGRWEERMDIAREQETQHARASVNKCKQRLVPKFNLC
jgi:hypothetical protein